MIKIEANCQLAPIRTQKAAHGSDAKWKFNHLPAQTDDLFKDLLVPLARKMADNLGPWEVLPMMEVQKLVDRVYGPDQYVVAEDNVWVVCPLSYRLNNWRNGFATVATESVKVMINNNADYFQTSQDIKDFIALCLEEVPVNPEHKESTEKGDSEVKPLMTAVYQWKEWNDSKKKQGLFQNQLIMRTFTFTHVKDLEDIKD
ncbi:hypothetical protein L208DRAFT_1245216 [Tricholoma matsutake]|nr:hypothetical protein L208DRAFT_1245216 [Tricholoma matsutake 945]